MNEQRKPRFRARWELEAGPQTSAAGGTEIRLIQGTLECLKTYGLRGTSSRAIAAAAGVNLGAITYHFGSKDELVARALLQAIRDWVEPALEILRRDMEPAARMVAAVETLRTTFEQARDVLSVYLEALVAASRSDALRRGVEELLREVRSFLSVQVGELRDVGYVPAWVEPDAIAALLIATADGLALHAALDPHGVDPQAVAAQAIQLLLAARTPPAETAGS